MIQTLAGPLTRILSCRTSLLLQRKSRHQDRRRVAGETKVAIQLIEGRAAINSARY
jgi:hypothetical protein